MKEEPTKKDIRRVQEQFLLSGWQVHPWFQKNFDEEFADYLNDFIAERQGEAVRVTLIKLQEKFENRIKRENNNEVAIGLRKGINIIKFH